MTVPAETRKRQLEATVWKSNPVQRQTKYVPRAASGCLRPKHKHRAVVLGERWEHPTVHAPTSRPCSHTLYLTTGNLPGLHHPLGRVKPHGFNGVWLKAMHTRKAQWSQGLKSLSVGAAPFLRIQRNTGTFVAQRSPARTERAVQTGRKAEVGSRRRGAVLHLPSTRISEPPSSCSAARPRHINTESETFWQRQRQFHGPWIGAITPPLPCTAPSPAVPAEAGLAGLQPARTGARSLQLQESLAPGARRFF